jgi:hypothetical protein
MRSYRALTDGLLPHLPADGVKTQAKSGIDPVARTHLPYAALASLILPSSKATGLL